MRVIWWSEHPIELVQDKSNLKNGFSLKKIIFPQMKPVLLHAILATYRIYQHKTRPKLTHLLYNYEQISNPVDTV